MIKPDPGCTLCRLSKTATRVCQLGSGPTRSEAMIIEESPGSSNKSRLMIARLMAEAGVDPKSMFVASAVSCDTPDGKSPTDSQIEKCRHWLNAQIKAVKPRFVLLLGASSYFAITGQKGITKVRGKPFEKDGIIYVPTFSPSYALRFPEAEYTITKDLELFRDIIERGEIPREKKLRFFVVDTMIKLKILCRRMRHQLVTVDIETTGLFPWAKDAKVNSIQFDIKGKQFVVFLDAFADPHEVVAMLDAAMETHNVQLIAHNGKFDLLYLLVQFGVAWYKRIVFDTMLAHFLLDENSRHGLKTLAQHYLGAPDWDVDRETKLGMNLTSKKAREKFALYGAHDVYYTRKLRDLFLRLLKQEPAVYKVFKYIMMPAVQMYVEAEFYGAPIDVRRLESVGKELHTRKDAAEKELQRYGKINWASPQQIAHRLFTELKVKVVERTKTGAPSTSESVLKRIDHPAVGALLRFREAKQQLSFFIEGWEPYLVDGWLHPSFKLHGTVTGRLSCENPNLQQVPRDPVIRSIIAAINDLHGEWELVEVDLSQVEMRIAAELSGAKYLLHCFLNGIDVHWLTAMTEIRRGKGKKELIAKTAKLLGCKSSKYDDQVDAMLAAGPDKCIDLVEDWKELRKKAKAVNFGYLFGMWWKKFKIYARDNYGVNVTDQEAQESRENYFMLFPELEQWQSRQRTYARFRGYVESLSGRKRRLPYAMIRNPKDPRRMEAERQAINSPVQSFANELNLMAALQLREEYDRDTVRIVGTVHDSTLFLVRRAKVVPVVTRMLEIMRRPKLMDKLGIKFTVPLEADAKIGPWGRGINLEKWKKANVGK